jgi:hypothetical protein
MEIKYLYLKRFLWYCESPLRHQVKARAVDLNVSRSFRFKLVTVTQFHLLQHK